VVYCLLANRLQFIDDSNQLPHARLNTTRAALCELLAIRVLNHYAKATEQEINPHAVRRHSLIHPIDSGFGRRPSLGVGSGVGSRAVAGARERRMSMAEPKFARMARKRADELKLANVLIAGFKPFAGAPEEVLEEEEMEGRKDKGKACNALELAIVTDAKHFVSVSMSDFWY
jgi:hypothetical protein